MNINLQFVAVATGTVNAITATYAPVPLALMDRMMVLFRATGANTITTPTFNPNNLGAKVIVKKGGVALSIGDITGAGFVGHLVYDAPNERWELLNPGASSGGGGGSVNSVTDDANGVVSVDNTDPSNPVIEFNGVNVDGITMSGDGTSGNPLVATGGILKGTTSGTDTYTTTITGVTAYNDGDAYLIRFGNGNTTVCTLNINSLGAISLYRNNDGELIGGDITDGAEMFCIYNSTANTFQVIGTAPNTLLAYVTNDDSVTITKGQPVYAFSGIGDRLTVKLASNTTDATSAQTVGLVLSTSIAANQKGLIIVNGLLDGLSTLPTSTFADGDAIYLGATAGTITNVKPSAPNHLVYLGFCTTASAGSAGRMYVRVQNGYELDEIHDVKIATPLNNQGIFYNNSNTLWENKAVISALSGTKSEFDTACSDGNFVFVGDAVLNPEGWNVIVKSANQDVVGSTLTDDTEMQFSVVSGGNYLVEFIIATSGNSSANDYQFRFALSTGLMIGAGSVIHRNGNNAQSNTGITASNQINTGTIGIGQNGGTIPTSSGVISASGNYSFYVNSNATFKFQFSTSGAGTTARTWKGSILKYKRLD